MTAGDAGRRRDGWVPSPPPGPASSPEPAEPARGHPRDGAPPRGVLAVCVVSAVGLSVLVGLSALAGPASTALAVAFAALVMAWGWAPLTDPPTPRVATAVVAAGSVAICATAALTSAEPYLGWVPVAVAASVVAVFLHHVLRGGSRPRLTQGVASAVGALALVASGAALIPLPRYPHGGAWALVASAAAAFTALPLPVTRLGAARLLAVVLVLGTGAAAVTALVVTGIPLAGAALLGVLTSAVMHSTQRVLVALPGSRSAPAALAAGAASVLVVGVLVYLFARVYSA